MLRRDLINVILRKGVPIASAVICCTVVGLNIKIQQDNRRLLMETQMQLDSINLEKGELLNTVDNLLSKVTQLEKDNDLLKKQNQSLKKTDKWYVVEGVATAYSPYENVSGIEHDGDADATSTNRPPGPKVFAVDPERIPYGSKMKIIYSDGTVKEGVAGDTGGAMRNDPRYHVDVYKDTYKETVEHGIQDVLIMFKPEK